MNIPIFKWFIRTFPKYRHIWKFVVIKEKQLGFDATPINIRGDPKKLKGLGWEPLVSIDNILGELV